MILINGSPLSSIPCGNCENKISLRGPIGHRWRCKCGVVIYREFNNKFNQMIFAENTVSDKLFNFEWIYNAEFSTWETIVEVVDDVTSTYKECCRLPYHISIARWWKSLIWL